MANTNGTASKASSAAGSQVSNAALVRSLKIYAVCITTVGLALGLMIHRRPSAPASGVCNGLTFSMLLPPPMGALSTESIIKVWSCTEAYQQANWWFVLILFEATYIGLKMLAIPATFALCVLAGALFPMPYCQLVTGFAEAFGSSLCYINSQTFLAPIVMRLFANKLAQLRERAEQERQYMLSFNLFLRLTPFMPNYLVNVACPLVGIPLRPFFIGSLFGTQLSLLFLALSGTTLKTAGETGFDMDVVKQKLKWMSLSMVILQCTPLVFIYLHKRRTAATSKKAK